MDEYDYEQEPEASKDQLKQLGALAALQGDLELAVAEAEEAFKEAKRALADVKEHQLPDLMLELGMTSFKTLSGLVISIKDKVSAKLTDATRKEGVAWLRGNGLGALVKNKFTMDFQRGDDKAALALVKHLDAQGIRFTQKEDVHHMTLSSTVKELLRDGVDVPTDLLNVFEKRTTKIG